MSAIKILLLLGIAGFAVLAFRGGQSAAHRAIWRVGGLGVMVAAGLSILFPDALTTIAQQIGVNRGSDLLLYVLVVTFLLVVVILFRRITELEQRLTHLTREMALAEARDRPGPTTGNDV